MQVDLGDLKEAMIVGQLRKMAAVAVLLSAQRRIASQLMEAVAEGASSEELLAASSWTNVVRFYIESGPEMAISVKVRIT